MAGWLRALAVLGLVGTLHVPLGDYLARTFTSARHWRAERVIYRACGINPENDQRWPHYAVSVLAVSGSPRLGGRRFGEVVTEVLRGRSPLSQVPAAIRIRKKAAIPDLSGGSYVSSVLSREGRPWPYPPVCGHGPSPATGAARQRPRSPAVFRPARSGPPVRPARPARPSAPAAGPPAAARRPARGCPPARPPPARLAGPRIPAGQPSRRVPVMRHNALCICT